MESEIRKSKTIEVGNKDSAKIADGIDRVIEKLERALKEVLGIMELEGSEWDAMASHHLFLLNEVEDLLVGSLDILKKGKER